MTQLKRSRFKIVKDSEIEPPLIETAQEYNKARENFIKAQNTMLAAKNKLSIALTMHMGMSHIRTNLDFNNIATAICTADNINKNIIPIIEKQLKLIKE